MSKKCISCGASLRDEAEFCPQCGTKQPAHEICPQCHAVLPEGAKFCTECGAPISHSEGTQPTVPPAPEPPAPEPSYTTPTYSTSYASRTNTSKRKYIIAVIIIAIVGIFIYFSGAIAPLSPAIPVKAEELTTAYIQNKANADKKYKNKTVEITGTLIAKSQFQNDQNYALVIYSRDEAGKTYSIVIDVDKKDVAKINTINEGDFVTVSGKCIGIVKQSDPKNIAIQISADTINE